MLKLMYRKTDEAGQRKEMKGKQGCEEEGRALEGQDSRVAREGCYLGAAG